MSEKKIGAGCIFTDGKLILAGLQYKQGQLMISGIGGKRNEGETDHETAMRETIEELFNVDNVSKDFINLLIVELPVTKICGTYTYTIYVYSFDDLQKLLSIAQTKIKSTIYETHPLSISDLLFKREYNSQAELPILCLVPVSQNLSFDSYFVEDIDRLLKMINQI